jgi:hypothetical protein
MAFRKCLAIVTQDHATIMNFSQDLLGATPTGYISRVVFRLNIMKGNMFAVFYFINSISYKERNLFFRHDPISIKR